MEREILFRAKLKDWKTNPKHNKWVEGFYMKRKETTYCFTEDYEKFPIKTLHFIAKEEMTDWGLPNRKMKAEIDGNTLCQYTNKRDFEGNKIFENDIIENRKGLKGVVKYDKNRLTYIVQTKKLNYTLYDMSTEIGVKVIGDIFNNADLIK